jgi:hypothetical protein
MDRMRRIALAYFQNGGGMTATENPEITEGLCFGSK